MIEKENLERLQKISELINSISDKCKNGISKALQDKVLLKPSILMQFVHINQLINKIQQSNDLEALALFNKDEIKGFDKISDLALNNYEAIDLNLLEEFIRENLANLKEKIDNSEKIIERLKEFDRLTGTIEVDEIPSDEERKKIRLERYCK